MRIVRAVLGIVASLVVLSASAAAGEKPIVIGEVSSQVARTGIDIASVVRAASEDEVRALDISHVPRGKHVIVSVALMRMETTAGPHTADARPEVSCEVSATLRDAKRGTLFATLEGKARARSDGASSNAERSALQGALHGALAHIPEVLGR